MPNPYPPLLADPYAFPDIQNYMRFGMGTRLLDVPTQNMDLILGAIARLNTVQGRDALRIHMITHPEYAHESRFWNSDWLVYEAGEYFVKEHLKKFSYRESPLDFTRRSEITPIPAFATAAIDEVKNSLAQRMSDIVRTNGPKSYLKAVAGELGGVDLHGGSLNWFLGTKILARLLVQRKVGIYVDAPPFGNTLADKGNRHPYLSVFHADDIRTWGYSYSGDLNEFRAVLLRERVLQVDPQFGLPYSEVMRYRYVYLDPKTGYVTIQFYDFNGEIIGPPIILSIRRIPFVKFQLTHSLMRNVAKHQIALLNLESSDISYALKSNFPFYIEQGDTRNTNPYTRQAQSVYQDYYSGQWPIKAATVAKITGLPPDTPNPIPAPEGGFNTISPTANILPPNVGTNFDAGPSEGRRYPIDTNPPAFIHPSSEPLKISMEKQDALKNDVRTLVHLALSSVQGLRAVSAESKKVDQQQGLEAGLAAIGIELQHGERQIAEHWAAYEGAEAATVTYPKFWSLKSVTEWKTETDTLLNIRETIPSPTLKREINKQIAESTVGTRVTNEVMEKIKSEIDSAKGGSSDWKAIASDVDNGLLGPESASSLRGYLSGEVEDANKHRAERLALIAQAQTSGKALTQVANSQAVKEDAGLQNPAARGISDLAVDPSVEAKIEKEGKEGRGEGKNNKEES